MHACTKYSHENEDYNNNNKYGVTYVNDGNKDNITEAK